MTRDLNHFQKKRLLTVTRLLPIMNFILIMVAVVKTQIFPKEPLVLNQPFNYLVSYEPCSANYLHKLYLRWI